jgi:hypothetical protein
MSATGESFRLAIDSPGRVPAPAQDQPRRIAEILNDFTSGLLQKPEHQRDGGLWDSDQKKAFILAVASANTGKQPLGVIATYELLRDGCSVSPQFLNDGLQRLTTLQEAIANPGRYAIGDDGAESLQKQVMTVQHRHYDTHFEAMRWFQYLNYGTQLTPYEHCQGYFAYLLPNYRQDWQPFFISLADTIARAETVVGIRNTKASRETRHKILRHHYALLWRFLTRDGTPSAYRDITSGNVRAEIEKDQTTEQQLIRKLVELGIVGARDELTKFDQHVRNEAAKLKKAIADTRGEGYSIEGTLFRWLLDASILRRFAEIPVTKFDEFVRAMITATRGRATWQRETASDINLRMANLEPFPGIAAELGFDFPSRRRRSRTEHIAPGYDSGHHAPFSVHGEGPTSPELASINRARGAQPR